MLQVRLWRAPRRESIPPHNPLRMTYLENFKTQRLQRQDAESDPPLFTLAARVLITLYPVDSTLVGQTGSVRSLRGRYGSRASEASTGAMLASPRRIPLRNRPRHPAPQQTQNNLRPRIRPKTPLAPSPSMRPLHNLCWRGVGPLVLRLSKYERGDVRRSGRNNRWDLQLRKGLSMGEG